MCLLVDDFFQLSCTVWPQIITWRTSSLGDIIMPHTYKKQNNNHCCMVWFIYYLVTIATTHTFPPIIMCHESWCWLIVTVYKTSKKKWYFIDQKAQEMELIIFASWLPWQPLMLFLVSFHLMMSPIECVVYMIILKHRVHSKWKKWHFIGQKAQKMEFQHFCSLVTIATTHFVPTITICHDISHWGCYLYYDLWSQST